MATDYFDFLNQSSQQDKPAPEEPKNDGLVNLTVRADAECQVVCDGEFWILLNANQVVKEKALAGQHLLEFISIDYPDVRVEKEVDWPDAGKNYLVIVKELTPLIAEKTKQAEVEKSTAEVKPRVETGKQDEQFCRHEEQVASIRVGIVLSWSIDYQTFTVIDAYTNNATEGPDDSYDAEAYCICHIIPSSWKAFYVVFVGASYQDIRIKGCSDNYEQMLRLWEDLVKDKVDCFGRQFGPDTDVSYFEYSEGRDFEDSCWNHYCLRKVSL